MSTEINMQHHRTNKTYRRVGVALLTVGLSGGSFLGLSEPASAQTLPTLSNEILRKSPLTPTQVACMTANGFPQKVKTNEAAQRGTGSPKPKKVKPTASEREAKRIAMAAAKATCGIPARESAGKKHKVGKPKRATSRNGDNPHTAKPPKAKK
jgi:hypothetical protein